MNPPVFIFGVPRSGTTLLRTMLDSHPDIAAGPEAPWLAHQTPANVRLLFDSLCHGPFSACANLGLSPGQVRRRVRDLVDGLFADSAAARGKARWAHKTPDDALWTAFFAQLFPDAKFIHLVRHPLDVALSTTVISPWRRNISEWYEQNIRLGHDCHVPNTLFNATLRWRWWNHLIRTGLRDCDLREISYDALAERPHETFADLCRFLGLPFHDDCIEYAKSSHTLPSWEWGSADVRQHQRVTPNSVGRWQRELDEHQTTVLRSLTGDQPTTPADSPRCRLGSVAEIQSPRFTLFMEGLNGLAKSFSLREHTNWSKVWEYPWLWFHGLADAVREQNRVVDIGSELSPMPWLMALCGARVTLVERDPQWLPVWEQLRRRLNVEVDWRIVTTEQLPFPDGSANAVTSFSVVEHQTDKRRAVDEIARILKPGGCLAVSFDIAEPSRGMEFPAWNGQALTLDGFEELIWRHPSFASASSPAWNLDDAPSLLQWHVRSAPHHRYVFGAALLRKQP